MDYIRVNTYYDYITDNGERIYTHEFRHAFIDNLIDPLNYFFMKARLDCQDYFIENNWTFVQLKDFQNDNISNMALEQDYKDKLMILRDYLQDYY
jgi:hypothetical protein|tara:strand:- start:32 stop:316 length:285 start_codon:yes stop_codon:yes gene_type:complete